MSETQFSPEVYRAYNLDLQHLDDQAARDHSMSFPGERRIYAATGDTRSFLSMRWLRGHGVEIGAGGNPTPLFGNAKSLVADCDEELAFGGKQLDFHKSLDAPDFAAGGRAFDFAVACHVLEHADSFLRALENLIAVTKVGGIVYIVVPDIEFLDDKTWLPHFDFEHHAHEYGDALQYAADHDRLYLDALDMTGIEHNEHAHISDEYQAAAKAGVLPQHLRFMHHKHNYRMQGWMDQIAEARKFLGGSFQIVDIRYGHERCDCHFVLEVLETTPVVALPEPESEVAISAPKKIPFAQRLRLSVSGAYEPWRRQVEEFKP